MSMTSYRPGVVVALAAAVASLLLALVFAAQPAGAAFSSKNGEITFVRDTRAAQATGEVYVMGPDGSEQTRLTNNAVFDGLPAFSPDGQRIAFTSRRNSQGFAANDEIFVMSPRDEDGDGNGDGWPRSPPPAPRTNFNPPSRRRATG